MKKKVTLIVLALLVLLGIGACIIISTRKEKEPTFDEFAESFEKSANEVLGEDLKKVSKT